jgi:class 3 adenylate cyclase/tetratricopeptide (TPR) repeat protein
MTTRRERKVVTVLFADLVGFTSRAESLDPEDVEAILRPYHERLRSELERYGGTVEKFIGDAVMALFGAPTAHEDDPERAVRAALAIRDWAREEGELEVRIGITTGEALVSLGARPEAGEGMVSGDVVNTASRLQAAASANGILVDETTYRATQQAIEFGEAEAVEAKGKAQPVPVWEVLEARSRFGIDVNQRMETALVGRRQELGVLEGALKRVREERSPQLVTLVGVPGIGKSRLVYELFQIVERDPDLIYWRQGRSLSYGEGASYWALAEIVKAQAGILETDSAESAAEKLHESVSAVVDDPADAAWIEGHLKPLLGLGGGSESSSDRQAEAASSWRRLFEAIADQRPLVLVFEDLHWADDGLLDFVDYIAEWASEVPLLIVCTARPELLARRPGWGGGKPNAVTLSLSPLSERETSELLAGLLEQSVLPAEVQRVLLERAEGNPLFAEEYVRMLQDRGFLQRRGRAWELATDGELPLPESVQGLIAGRLDALPAEEKVLVQDAAVVGKIFWAGALESLSGIPARELEDRLHSLVRRELVRRERRSSVAGETQYSFLHLLMRDVAYGQIPRAQRADKHRLAADWIESLGGAESHSDLLAHHYMSVLELAGAAGVDTSAIADRARAAFVETGDRARSLNSFLGAARFYSAALQLVTAEDPAWPHLVLRLEGVRTYLGEGDLSSVDRAIELLISRDEFEAAAEAETHLADVLHGQGDVRAAGVHLDRALELIADKPPSRAKAGVLALRSKFAMVAGQRGATEGGREALALAERLGLDELRANLLNTIGSARLFEGDSAGLEDLKQSLALALEIKSPNEIQRSYNNVMEGYRRLGNWPEASRTLVENRKALEVFGIPGPLRWVRAEEAHDAYYTGNWDESTAAASDVIALAEAGHSIYLQPIARAVRAKVRFARGDQQGADEDATLAVELAAGSDPQVVSTVLGYATFLLLEEGRRVEASRLVDKALAVPAYVYGVVDVAFVLRELGRGAELSSWVGEMRHLPWAAVGEAIVAGDLGRAAEILGEMGNAVDEAYVRLRTGREADVRRALEFYRAVGATRYIQESEALLAKTA